MKEFVFQRAVGTGEVDAVLGFGMTCAVGASGHGKKRWGLDAFGDRHAGELSPPAFEVADEVGGGGEDATDKPLFTTDGILECAVCIVCENVGRGADGALFDEGTE